MHFLKVEPVYTKYIEIEIFKKELGNIKGKKVVCARYSETCPFMEWQKIQCNVMLELNIFFKGGIQIRLGMECSERRKTPAF